MALLQLKAHDMDKESQGSISGMSKQSQKKYLKRESCCLSMDNDLLPQETVFFVHLYMNPRQAYLLTLGLWGESVPGTTMDAEFCAKHKLLKDQATL